MCPPFPPSSSADLKSSADDRIEQLFSEVSTSSNVKASNVLMFLADGREIKQDILEQAWDRGGEAGASSVSFPRAFRTKLRLGS